MADFDRAAGVGGSDVAPILGISPWRDIIDVWREKTRDPHWRPKPMTEEMRWGLLLEPVMRSEYERRTGLRVVKRDTTFWAPDGLRYAHLDGLVLGHEEGIWEGKVPFNTARDWRDGPPAYVQSQVQHYLEITEEPWCDVSALFPGADFQTFRVWADKATQENMRVAVLRFWENHVLPAVPPAPLPVQYRFPTHVSDFTVVASPDDEAMVRQLWGNKSSAAGYSMADEQIKALLKERIGTAAGMIGDGWRIRWKKNRDSVEVDWQNYAKSLEAVIDQIRAAENLEDVAQFLTDYDPHTILSLYTNTKPGQRPFVLEEVKDK